MPQLRRDHHPPYVHGVEHFSRYFRRRPDQLGPEHIQQYRAMLFSKLKYSPNTVRLRLASLRFFYIQVLKKSWSIAETPYPKKVVRLPLILIPDEVARLIDAADSPFHRAMLMTLYGTGARRTEVAHLKVGDIDSRRMVVHIRGGKGNLDRDVMLSHKLLDALRDYWRGLRRSSTDWLFRTNSRSLPRRDSIARMTLHIAPQPLDILSRSAHGVSPSLVIAQQDRGDYPQSPLK